MATVQVRDVSDETVKTLKTRAAQRGQTLSAYLRDEMDRLASRSTNAEVLARLATTDRTGGPTTAETVALIREARESR